MPEGYTHFRIAAKAAAAVRYKVKWPAAFAAGANGPDIFFCFEAWRKAAKRRYDLPALGRRMHEENTGAFLQSLVRHVRTAPQVEYALGFLSHYAADTVLHPYVAALCRPGMPYAEPGGHGYFEIALDSTLHAQDTGSAVVPSQEACPTPAGEALADIVDLLHTALQEAYDLDIPAEYLADSFYYSTKLRGMFTSRYGVRKAFFGLIEPLFGGRGTITGHVSPRKLKPDLPDAWCDPTTGEPRTGDVYALMEQAQERSAQYMAAAILIWNGRQTYAFLDDLLGSMSYSTGTATAQSDPNYVPPEPSKEAEAAQAPADGQAPVADEAAPAENVPAAEAEDAPAAENAPTTAGEALLAAVAPAVEETPAEEGAAAPAETLPAAEAESTPEAENAPTAAGETLLAAVAETSTAPSEAEDSPAPAPAQETPAPEQETPAPEQETPAPAEAEETPPPEQETPAPAAVEEEETPAPAQGAPAPDKPPDAAPADSPEPPPAETAPDVTPAPTDDQPPAGPPAPAAAPPEGEAPPAEASPGTEPPPTADGEPAPAQGMPAPEEAPAPEAAPEAPAPLEDAPTPPAPADTPAPTQEGGNT